MGEARRLAAVLLGRLGGGRWWHTAGVAAVAERIAGAVPPTDRPLLTVAAWLHDIGYSPGARDTGFHPLDGARLLRRLGWPERLCALMAHHSGARFQARVLGLSRALAAYPFERSPVSDALAYADQTVGPHGEPMPIGERIEEALRRHGPGSVLALAHPGRGAYLLAAAARVERLLPVPA